MQKRIILVNDQDKEIGTGEKIEVHKKGLLHRAFSIFIFDWTTHKMLIQKRAKKKYHSGGLWTNACCSHPLSGMELKDCIKNRLISELGLEVDFKVVKYKDSPMLLPSNNEMYYAGKFHYNADLNQLSEHEIDYVFLYSPLQLEQKQIIPNGNEIEEIKWVTIDELTTMLECHPQAFTAWFEEAYTLIYPILLNQAHNMGLLIP